jgi:EmrB/QacA subfamily drug resistance transporter
MSPQTLVIIAAIFPAERRGAALGITASITALATVAGPTVGGYLVSYVDWRWIFFMNVPIGIAGFVATFFLIPDLRPGRKHRLDVIGVVLASLGLGAIVYGLIEGQRYDWATIGGTSLTIPEVLAAGLLLLAAFVLWQRTRPEPLVPLSLFRDRGFAVATWLAGLSFFGTFGFALVFTIYFQTVLGMSAINAGLATLPFAISLAVAAPFAGRLTDRIGGRYVLMLGALLYAIGLVTFALVSTTTATWQTFVLPFIVAGLGMGNVTAPSMTVALHDIKPAMTGAASGVFNTARQVGGAVGAALVGAILQNRIVSATHDNAVAASAQLPARLQSGFVSAFANAAHNGLEIGRGQSGGAQLPPGISPALAQQVQSLIHEVFVNSFVSALQPALFVPAAAFAIGALSCFLIASRRSAAVAPVATRPGADPARAERLVAEKEA